MPFNTLIAALYNRELGNTNVQMAVYPSLAAAKTLTSHAGAYGAPVAADYGTIIADAAAPTTADYWIAGFIGANPNAAAAAYYEIFFGKGSAAPVTLNFKSEIYMPAAFTAVGEFLQMPVYFPLPLKVVGSSTSGLVMACSDSVGGKTLDVKAILLTGLGT